MNIKTSLLKILARLKQRGERLLAPVIRLSKKLVLPGLDGISLYEVSVFFYRGITKSSLNLRASAISFDFIMALAPAVLFLFTLIPYLPIPDLQQTVLDTIQTALPKNAFLTVQSTINDVMSRSQRGLLSLGFLLSIFFSSNGMMTVIRAFNQYAVVKETRTSFRLRLLSLLLVLLVTLMMLIASALQVLSYWILDLVGNLVIITPFWLKAWFLLAKYLVFLTLLLSVFSVIYYLAPAKRGMFRLISAGSTMATVITIIILELFSYFINNFGHYNTVYGSLGTLIVIFLWININALILLIGFELNASIYEARRTAEHGHS
jgi:membrane protein